jgi:hypothetical protein
MPPDSSKKIDSFPGGIGGIAAREKKLDKFPEKGKGWA